MKKDNFVIMDKNTGLFLNNRWNFTKFTSLSGMFHSTVDFCKYTIEKQKEWNNHEFDNCVIKEVVVSFKDVEEN